MSERRADGPVSGGCKYTEFDVAPDSAHNLVVSLVQPGGHVLEFGCATGYMSEALKTRLGCVVTGIELSPAASELAQAHCERVIVGNAEALDLHGLFGKERFDTIIFADFLEHLKEPDLLLRRVRPFVAEGGAVVASIPNIAHGSVRLALLGGEFRYREFGLLDRTHLRFFTRESAQDLFEAAGYLVTHWLRRRVEIDGSEISLPIRGVPDVVREWLVKDPEATTYQFVVRAVPAEAAEIVRHLRAELARVTAEIEEIERRQRATQELLTLVGSGEAFILVDEDQWGDDDLLPGRRRLPFLERNGQYWGPPPDDDTAIRELERLRQAGAGFMVFGWPAFWWLEHYRGLQRHLRLNFRCLIENERLVVFDLRQ